MGASLLLCDGRGVTRREAWFPAGVVPVRRGSGQPTLLIQRTASSPA